MQDQEPEVWDDAREWAERNNFSVFEDYPKDGILADFNGEYRYVLFDGYGNPQRMEMSGLLCNDEGDISFGLKQMTVTDESGDKHYVSEKKFPVER